MREWMLETGRRLAGPVALGVVLGLIGPFGTFALLPTLPRIGYWLAIVAFNWLLCDIAIRRVDALASADLPLRRAIVPLAGALIVSLPATGVVSIAGALSGIGWPESLLTLFWQVALLLAAISLPLYTLADLREAAETTGAPPGQSPDTPMENGDAETGLALFKARLPGPLKGRLLCLEMQDHYLAVHTTAGSELILCRMEDAARELGALGRRVHRSWWVAENAVEAVERDGQRVMLRLSDDRRVPVSRTYRAGLKRDGWLDASNFAIVAGRRPSAP